MALLDDFLQIAHSKNASDLHLGEGHRPYIRVDGELMEYSEYDEITDKDSMEIAHSVLTKEQVEYAREYGEDIEFAFDYGDEMRVRGHFYLERGRPSFAFRILPSYIPSPASLGIPEAFIKKVQTEKSGLFLVTGPTGSGKTTTLASLVNVFNQNSHKHIVTIEDPIEYVFNKGKSLVKQRQVRSSGKGDVASFSRALRSALREDPDIIFVGEMRDKETMRLAMRAAETGHIVFSTLHTSHAWQIPNRIINSFRGEEQSFLRQYLAHSLKGALSQRLLPRSDGSGLVAAFETMLVNPAIRHQIQEGKLQGIQDTMQTSADQGMSIMENVLENMREEGIIN